MEKKSGWRKISISLYLTAFLITALIFGAGIFVGKALERTSLGSISEGVDAANLKAARLELFYLIGDSADFCPVYIEELSKIDREVEELGYKLSYLEGTKGITDVELKRNYFMLEAEAFLFSQRVKRMCGANYSTILYFYSNANCSSCEQQGKELLEVKKELGENIRIYSFDGDLGSSIVDAFKMKYKIAHYPSLVINGTTYSGLRKKGWIIASLKK